MSSPLRTVVELEPLLDGVSVALGDVSSMVAVTALLPHIDHIVYVVGSASPVESDLDPASDVTLVVPPVVRLLELLRLRPTVGLTYISSVEPVYGNITRGLPVKHHRQNPSAHIRILKLTVENIPVHVRDGVRAVGPGPPGCQRYGPDSLGPGGRA